MRADSITADPRLADKRADLRARYHRALTSDQEPTRRRLLDAGRVAEARALVEQSTRFFLAACEAFDRMNEFELAAFERATGFDGAVRCHQVVATVLLRCKREMLHRQIERHAAPAEPPPN